ncbi:MAG: hypothetical protein RLZZ450_6350 [Pseudomonadota bacterium]|jgi:hypothetical protein
MPAAKQHQSEPLHDHDLELANHGGVLLRDSVAEQAVEQSPAQEKQSEQTAPRQA